jgi:hypothetical protein
MKVGIDSLGTFTEKVKKAHAEAKQKILGSGSITTGNDTS